MGDADLRPATMGRSALYGAAPSPDHGAMPLILLGYLGAAGIVAFATRSAYAAILGGRAADHDPLAFGVLAAAGVALTADAQGLGDPVFTLANGASALANSAVVAAAWRARRSPRLA